MVTSYPPFPSNLPVAPLRKISYQKLLDNDPDEELAMFDGAETNGFFLLDLTTVPGAAELLGRLDEAESVGKTFFNTTEMEEKKKYKMDRNLGYKPIGALSSFPDGRRDRAEIVAVPKDDIVHDAAIPETFAKNRDFLKSTCTELEKMAAAIFRGLAKALELPAGAFTDLHNPKDPSITQLRFLHYFPQPEDGPDPRNASLPGHTDSGSLTILFSKLGGLQILPPNKPQTDEEWVWMKPEPGCAIVNIGDPMVAWSGGILRSAFHRVLYTPGEQSKLERYSWGYFIKPADEASMVRLTDGTVIPKRTAAEEKEETLLPAYKDWHKGKAVGIDAGRNDVKSMGGIRKWKMAA